MLTYEEDLLPNKILATKQNWYHASFCDEHSFYWIFLHSIASKFLFQRIFQRLFLYQIWQKIADAGIYKSIAISIYCFNKFFKSPHLICIGLSTLEEWCKETR